MSHVEPPAPILNLAQHLMAAWEAPPDEAWLAGVAAEDIVYLHAALVAAAKLRIDTAGLSAISLLGIAAAAGMVDWFKLLFMRACCVPLQQMFLSCNDMGMGNEITVAYAVFEFPHTFAHIFGEDEDEFENSGQIIPWVRQQEAQRRWRNCRWIGRVLLWHARTLHRMYAPGGAGAEAAQKHFAGLV